MSSLRQMESNGNYPTPCQYDHDLLTGIAEGTKANTEAIKTLTTYHREMTRWLLIVVCVIALGNKAVDLAKDLWGSNSVKAESK